MSDILDNLVRGFWNGVDAMTGWLPPWAWAVISASSTLALIVS